MDGERGGGWGGAGEGRRKFGAGEAGETIWANNRLQMTRRGMCQCAMHTQCHASPTQRPIKLGFLCGDPNHSFEEGAKFGEVGVKKGARVGDAEGEKGDDGG